MGSESLSARPREGGGPVSNQGFKGLALDSRLRGIERESCQYVATVRHPEVRPISAFTRVLDALWRASKGDGEQTMQRGWVTL